MESKQVRSSYPGDSRVGQLAGYNAGGTWGEVAYGLDF